MENSTYGFSQRRKAYEAKYLHDEELNFRTKAKGNYLFGLWAAKLLGYTDKKAENYAEEVMVVEIQKIHNQDALSKVIKDLEAAGIEISPHRIQKEFQNCMETAREIIINKEVI